MNTICRCCIKENLLPLYNIFHCDLLTALVQCAPNVHIGPDDGLPQVICDLCRRQLEAAMEFRQKCEEADRVWRARSNETSKAIDKVLGLEILTEIREEKSNVQNVDQMLEAYASLEMTVLNDLILEDHSFDISPDNSGTTEEDPIIEELISHFLDTPSKQPPFQIDQNIRTQIESPADVVPHVTRTHSKNNDNEEDRDFKSPPEAGKNQSKPQYQCSQCVKNFTRNFQLRLHMISIHGIGDGPQYPCEICKKVFASKNSLTYHCKALHSVERQFRCPHCDKGFVLRTQLTSHIGIHSGQVKARIHLCMECGKSWPTKSDLRTHMRSHNTNGERPYKCKQCDRSFYTKGHLKEHHLVHTGEKPYVCVFCLKAYKSAGSLNTHIYRIHNELLTVNTTAAKMTATKTPMMMMMASGQTEKNFS